MGLYYEQQLEAKIKRQKSEITRLLKENAELKSNRAEGQQKAWNLAQKVYLLPESFYARHLWYEVLPISCDQEHK